MRKNVLNAVTLLAFTAVLTASCGSSKQVPITKVNQETEVLVPCADYYTDADYFRGQGVGQSKDLNTAREKARMAAATELAGSMRTWIKQLSEKYINDAGQVPSDYSEIFESLTRQKVDEQISNMAIACNKTVRTTDGMYKVYLAMEADRRKVFEAFDRALATEKKVETLYNREKFRAVYDSEMESFKNQNK